MDVNLDKALKINEFTFTFTFFFTSDEGCKFNFVHCFFPWWEEYLRIPTLYFFFFFCLVFWPLLACIYQRYSGGKIASVFLHSEVLDGGGLEEDKSCIMRRVYFVWKSPETQA
jgi:hypothetical protein